MNEKTLENFKKLSPDKQDELIALIVKLLSCCLSELFQDH